MSQCSDDSWNNALRICRANSKRGAATVEMHCLFVCFNDIAISEFCCIIISHLSSQEIYRGMFSCLTSLY